MEFTGETDLLALLAKVRIKADFPLSRPVANFPKSLFKRVLEVLIARTTEKSKASSSQRGKHLSTDHQKSH